MSSTQPMSVGHTLKGIGIRAGILTVGGLVAGGWLTAFALRAAGRLLHLLIGLVLMLMGVGAATYEVNKLKKRLTA